MSFDPLPLAQGFPAHMSTALGLAQQAIGLSDPNPRVGCVITSPDGRVIGQGYTQAAGQSHAEIMALADAKANGESCTGSTVYVTLEPCSHQGRTAACCDALIAAKVQKVIIAIQDPNPLVAGQGIVKMRAAGILVELLSSHHDYTEAAKALNIGFFSRMQRHRPWVRLKLAASLDGFTALPNGQSQWITGLEARTDGHAWRKRAGAILTGASTLRFDDPKLTVRLVPTQLQPLRVVLDGNLATPLSAQLIQTPGAILVYGSRTLASLSCQNQPLIEARKQALEALGIEVALLDHEGQASHIKLASILQDLAIRGINELHIEAGPKLNGSFIRQGLVDEYLIYIAPKFLGSGFGFTDIPQDTLSNVKDALDLRFISITPFGVDMRILARPLSNFDSRTP